jgi:hypothetical protein
MKKSSRIRKRYQALFEWKTKEQQKIPSFSRATQRKDIKLHKY